MSGRGKSAKNKELIATAYDILAEIQPATVRAVCYQLFNRRLIANMSKAETNKVSVQLRDGREAGVIPWEWIVDETREAERIAAWQDPAAYVETVKRAYRRDRWADQPERLEVWSEKGTVRGTLAPVLGKYGVTFRVMHGYGSATTLHQVAKESLLDARPLTALYVGDYDPSGLHISEVDLPERLARYGAEIDVRRIALLSDDCDVRSGLPSFRALSKRGDPRFQWYVSEFGYLCWELDAMRPNDLRDRVEGEIRSYIDVAAWQRADGAEAAEIESLSNILNQWPGISERAPKCDRGGE